MALGKKYTFDFIDSAIGTLLKYEIWAEGYTGDPIVLTVAGDDTIIITTEGRDTRIISAGIKGSSATLQLSTRSGLRMRDFLTENPRQFQLRAFKNTYMQFIGWAQPILSDEPLRPAPYSFELTFSDALADLTKVNLKKNDAIPSQPLGGPELLALCLKQTGYSLPIVIVDNLYQNQLVEIGDTPTQSSWEGWQWETLRFFDGAEPWNVYRILENLCKRRTATLMQADGRWWFIRLPDYRTNPVKAWQYDANGANPTSFDWTHTVDIPYNVTATQASALLVMKGLESNAKSWNPSLKKVIHRIQYGHFRNQLLGQLFDGSLNYEYIITTIGGEVVAADAGGALNLKNFKFKTPKEGATVGLPAGIPYARTNYFQFQFRTKDTVKTNMASENNYVRFLEKKVGKTELVRFTTRLQNVDFKGGRVCIVAYSIANLPDMLEDLGDTQQIIKAFTERRFLDASGAWVIEPTVIDIENTEKKEIDDETVDVSSDEPRTFTVTSTTPYPVNNQDAYIRIYLLSGELLENTEADEENRYTLYDEISLETSQYFKDKKITAHEVKVENLANEYGETLEEEIEIGETLNDLNYAYPLGISNTPSGLASAILRNTGWWYEYGIAAPEPPINYFRSQNEWAAYSMLRMRQALQMVISGVLRGYDYGPHHMFRIVGGGDDYDGKVFLVLSRQRDEWRSTSDVTLSEWIYAPVTVKISRKATTGTEGTPLGSGSTFENWYSSSRGGVSPDTRGGRVGVPEDGGGGGLPDSLPDSGSTGVINEKLEELTFNAYVNRGIIEVGPLNFKEISELGSFFVSFGYDWPDDVTYMPYDLTPVGHLQVFRGGDDEGDLRILHYRDAWGFEAMMKKDASGWGEWVYIFDGEIVQSSEEGKQLIYRVVVKDGLIIEAVPEPIRTGFEPKGFLEGQYTTGAVPTVNVGENLNPINGVAFWIVREWSEIIDRPNDWTGRGFLKVTYANGNVELSAYALSTGKTAQKLREGLNGDFTPWFYAMDPNNYFTREEIQFFVSSIYGNINRQDAAINELNIKIATKAERQHTHEMLDVLGLIAALQNKIPLDIFTLSNKWGYVLALGDDSQPTLIDMSGTQILVRQLPKWKAESMFSFNIPATEIVWPENAKNKKFEWVVSQDWLANPNEDNTPGTGGIWYTEQDGITIGGNPDTDEDAIITFFLSYQLTIKGKVITEEHVRTIRVMPADVVVAIPDAPSSLVATVAALPNAHNRINIAWTDNADDETAFELQQYTGGTWVLLTVLGTNTTTYAHTGLTASTEYKYRVRAINSAGNSAWSNEATATTASAPIVNTGGLYGRYYNGMNFNTLVAERVDKQVDFLYSAPTSPIAGVSPTNYSVRWSGYLKVPNTGNYLFRTMSDDGVRIWVKGPVGTVGNANSLEALDWESQATDDNQFPLNMSANALYALQIEYFQDTGPAEMRLQYNDSGTWKPVPEAWMVPDADMGKPIATPSLSLTTISPTEIRASWTQNESAPYRAVDEFFIIYKATDSANWSVDLVGGSVREKSYAVEPNKTYEFRVRGMYLNRFGEYDSETSGTSTGGETGEPATPTEPMILWNFDGLDGVISNGLFEDAYNHGVRGICINELAWGLLEKAENDYNFDELDWMIETLMEKGYKFLLWTKPRFALSNAGNVYRPHRRSGGGWTQIEYFGSSTSYLPASSYDRDRDGNIVGNDFNLSSQAPINYVDATGVNKFMQLVARICDRIDSTTYGGSVAALSGKFYSEYCIGVGIIDGDFNETGFPVQNFPSVQDGGYSDAEMADFRAKMQTKYGSIAALNTSWGSSYNAFSAINRASVPKPPLYDNGRIVDYNANNATRDLLAYRIQKHQTFYARFMAAVRSPALEVEGLQEWTGLRTACYLTENFGAQQGITWGTAFASMFSGFDIYLSSISSGGSPPYGGTSLLGAFALRMAWFRGCFGNAKAFGQEQDGDPVDRGIGQSKSAAATFASGAKYSVIALQTDRYHWERQVQSSDGQMRTYFQDLLYTYNTYCKGKESVVVFPSQTLTYTQRNALSNVGNPENIINRWIAASGVNNDGFVVNDVNIRAINDFPGSESNTGGNTGGTETLPSSVKAAWDGWVDSNIGSYVQDGEQRFVAMVWRAGQLWTKQVGTISANDRINVASLSKTFAAAVIMKLIDEGYLSLSTTTGEIIPSFGFVGGAKASITVEQLLSMKSGLRGNYIHTAGGQTQPYEDQSGLTMTQAVDFMAANTPLDHGPGTYFDYGGTHWQIVARMAEIVTGQSWVQICQSRLWTPMGMANVDYIGDNNPMIHAGLRVSLNDWMKFARLFPYKGMYNTTRIISENGISAMLVNRTAGISGAPAYGFGFYVGEENMHAGAAGSVVFYNTTLKYVGTVFTLCYNENAAIAQAANDNLRNLICTTIPNPPSSMP